MGHTQDEKAETRERILQVAARRFREDGIHGVSIADLMNEAGLTHGGFYKHFKSREDLVAKAVDYAIGTRDKNPVPNLNALLDGYLSTKHRDAPGQGCGFTALAGDVARADEGARLVFTDQLKHALRRLARLARTTNEDDSAQTAMFRLSAMVGALTLARAVNDPDLSEALLLATRNNIQPKRPRATASACRSDVQRRPGMSARS